MIKYRGFVQCISQFSIVVTTFLRQGKKRGLFSSQFQCSRAECWHWFGSSTGLMDDVIQQEHVRGREMASSDGNPETGRFCNPFQGRGPQRPVDLPLGLRFPHTSQCELPHRGPSSQPMNIQTISKPWLIFLITFVVLNYYR